MNYQYDPLHWPPDLALAGLHLRCSRPGIENADGPECPCCSRKEKLKNSKWPSRDITRDFRNYGGSVPAYFALLKYFSISFIIIILLVVVFHIYILESTCPSLKDTDYPCTSAFFIFKFCDSKALYLELVSQGRSSSAAIFNYLQLTTYLLLVVATIVMKIWLQHINHTVVVDQKILSKFALILKNVPKFYSIESLRKELLAIDDKLDICELFYIHRTADLDKTFRQYFDLYFQIKYNEENPSTDDKHRKHLDKLYARYLQLATAMEEKGNFQAVPSKRAVVVFNTIEQRNFIYETLKINSLRKSLYYTFKMIKINTQTLSYFAEDIAQPQQIYWKNIGQSSTYKTKVRFLTSFIGFGFMIASFGLFYLPMIRIDEAKKTGSSVSTLLGILISLAVIILAIIYRHIILKLMHTRRPSSKLAQSYFIVMTTVIFHIFFYLVTPATYYVFVEQVPQNFKLKQLFLAVLTFIMMTTLVAVTDTKYRIYNQKKKKLLYTHSVAHRYCQQRLHEQLSPPSFPIEFKLMVILNIWTFNGFYVFQLPYLLILFLLVLALLYWIDKRNLYKHYKMQSYMSIELQLKVQKIYIILFLLCVSVGYAISAFEMWERYLIIVIIILALVVNETLNISYKRRDSSQIVTSSTLKNILSNPKKSMRQDLMDHEVKDSFFIPEDNSMISLGTSLYNYSYSDVYQRYLNQFKNKTVIQMLHNKAIALKKISLASLVSANPGIRKESELTYLGLQEKLLSQNQTDRAQEEVEITHQVKSDVKSDVKSYIQSDVKSEVKSESKPRSLQ